MPLNEIILLVQPNVKDNENDILYTLGLITDYNFYYMPSLTLFTL